MFLSIHPIKTEVFKVIFLTCSNKAFAVWEETEKLPNLIISPPMESAIVFSVQELSLTMKSLRYLEPQPEQNL